MTRRRLSPLFFLTLAMATACGGGGNSTEAFCSLWDQTAAEEKRLSERMDDFVSNAQGMNDLDSLEASIEDGQALTREYAAIYAKRAKAAPKAIRDDVEYLAAYFADDVGDKDRPSVDAKFEKSSQAVEDYVQDKCGFDG